MDILHSTNIVARFGDSLLEFQGQSPKGKCLFKLARLDKLLDMRHTSLSIFKIVRLSYEPNSPRTSSTLFTPATSAQKRVKCSAMKEVKLQAWILECVGIPHITKKLEG